MIKLFFIYCKQYNLEPVRSTHPKLYPFIQQSLVIEFTQQAWGGDAESAAGLPALATSHITEEVVPKLTQQPRTTQ